jgi:hypothetical protein
MVFTRDPPKRADVWRSAYPAAGPGNKVATAVVVVIVRIERDRLKFGLTPAAASEQD